MDQNGTHVTTSFLLSNLHCPSCVAHIQGTLFSLDPRPASVSPSLVSSWVTVAHDRSLSKQDMQDALESAGFDVCSTTPDPSGKPHLGLDSEIGYLDRFLDRLKPDKDINGKAEQSSRHLDNCESCRLQAGGKEVSGSKPPPLVENGGEEAISVVMDEKAPPLVVVDSGESQDTWRASLAIGGMTCAACVVTITEELEKKDWIRKVAVNLITNSATVDFIGEQHKNDVVESIEDIGYDAAIDSVIDLKTPQNASSEGRNIQRTVDILVEGMYCEHCPLGILASLEDFVIA